MKKALLIIATVFLVVACATTGVFAGESTVAPTVELGSYLNFSQVSSGQTFLKVNPDGVTPVVGTYYHVFNNVYIKCTAVTSNRASFVPAISNDGSSFTDYSGLIQNDTTVTGYFIQFSFNSNGTLYVRGTYSSNTASTVLLSYVNPIISFGSSIIWDEPYTTVGEVIPFTLTPGYALVINGPCEVSDRTYSITGSWNFDKLATSRINGSFERLVQTNTLIDGFSPDRYLSIEQLLPWWAENSNVVGVASNYSYHNTDVITLSDGGVNYVLGYPLYYQGSGDYSVSHENAVSLTGSIYIQYSGTRPTISKIALESIADIVEGHYHYYNVFRPDVYDETGEVVSDGSGGIVVEFPDAPSGGGNSGQPPVNEETNLFGVLSKFVNDIKNLISQGSHAISELVNYGSSFMHSIAQMYDWLPATLTTLIVTAFSIVLVIGVIKLLWK